MPLEYQSTNSETRDQWPVLLNILGCGHIFNFGYIHLLACLIELATKHKSYPLTKALFYFCFFPNFVYSKNIR